MSNYKVLKRKAVSRRVLELSCTQTDNEFADPLASLIAQPKMFSELSLLLSGVHLT